MSSCGLWPRTRAEPRIHLDDPLRFAEIAANSAIYGRRMLTYRLSKAAADRVRAVRQCRCANRPGLNWHKKMEPYVPHHLGGFMLFRPRPAGQGRCFLAAAKREPAAMVVAAGLFQIGRRGGQRPAVLALDAVAGRRQRLWKMTMTRNSQPTHHSHHCGDHFESPLERREPDHPRSASGFRHFGASTAC